MFRKAKLNSAVLSVITASLAAGTAPIAMAQLEEVLVTATKRTESTQDIPVTVSAITSDKLDQLGIIKIEVDSLFWQPINLNLGDMFDHL